VAIRPEVTIDVALYWHQWKLSGGVDPPGAGNTPPARPGLMEQIGQALITGARGALLQ
jgi:LysR family transcriptional regulator (chromosome initiation inhibitor)